MDVERAAALAEEVDRFLVGAEDRLAVFGVIGRELGVLAALHIVAPEIARDGRGVVLAVLVFAAFFIVVIYGLAVFGHPGVLSGHGEQLGYPAAVGRDAVQLGLRAVGVLAVLHVVLPQRAEDDGFAVGGKAVRYLLIGMKGEAARLASGGGHREDVEVAVALGGEGELFAVFAPGSHVIVAVVEGQLGCRAASCRYFIEVAFVGECNLATVGRNGRVAQPVWGRLSG